jgi:hypothetical protein
MPGKAKASAEAEKVGLRVPLGLYREMMAVIEAAKMWPDPPRQNFILEAIKEKTERWRKDHPMWTPPARDRSKER